MHEDADSIDRSIAPVLGVGDRRRFTDSGIEVAEVYSGCGREGELEGPGEFPYTRGIHREMYRSRLWTMRQYAGYASAEESNARYRYLLAHGSTGLSMASQLTRSKTCGRCSRGSRSLRFPRR
jgi:methylmalonyl-CoA mutase N-terminal domain/subunit